MTKQELRARCDIDVLFPYNDFPNNYVTILGPDGKDWRCQIAWNYKTREWDIIDIDEYYEDWDTLDKMLYSEGYADVVDETIKAFDATVDDYVNPRWSSKRECVI